jgi:hypothetical protein
MKYLEYVNKPPQRLIMVFIILDVIVNLVHKIFLHRILGVHYSEMRHIFLPIELVIVSSLLTMIYLNRHHSLAKISPMITVIFCLTYGLISLTIFFLFGFISPISYLMALVA